MKMLFAIGLVATLTASAAQAMEAPGTGRWQRQAAYAECANKAAQAGTMNMPSIVSTVAANYGFALTNWAKSSLRAQPDLGCYAFLTSKERAAQSAAEKDGHARD